MGRKKTRSGEQLSLLRKLSQEGKSANYIQNELRQKNLGMRRKTLLLYIRANKKTGVSEEKRKRSIPKKYRKKGQQYLKDMAMIYRASYIIRDIPVHSRISAKNYLGFRLTVFSFDSEDLKKNHKHFKELLEKETSDYLGFKVFENFNWSHRISIEYPVLIAVNNAYRFNNIWIFRVENDGLEVYSKDGRF